MFDGTSGSNDNNDAHELRRQNNPLLPLQCSLPRLKGELITQGGGGEQTLPPLPHLFFDNERLLMGQAAQ